MRKIANKNIQPTGNMPFSFLTGASVARRLMHVVMGKMKQNKMGKLPAILDGARVLKYAIIDESVTHTGKMTLIVGGTVMGPVAGIAICKYDEQEDFLILYCNKKWRSVGAGGYPSIKEAISSLEKAYKGITTKWQDMP